MEQPNRVSIFKTTWSLSVSLVMARLLNMITGFINMILIGRLGPVELASSALVTTVQTTCFVILICFQISSSILMSQAFGAKDFIQVGKTLRIAFIFSLILASIGMLILANIHPILLALGEDPTLCDALIPFFKYLIFAQPAIMLSVAAQFFLSAVGQQKIVAWLSFLYLIICPCLTYVFIYGHFGPAFEGMHGLGLSYLICSWFMLGITLLYLKFYKGFQEYSLFDAQLEWPILLKLLKLGWPIGMQAIFDLMAWFFVTIMVGWLGATALGAQQISTQYFFLCVVPVFALSQTSSILVGRSFGAKDFNLIKAYSNMTALIAFGFSACIMLAFTIFHSALVHIYLGHDLSPAVQEVAKLAEVLLIFTGVRVMFDALGEVKTGSLRGVGDTKVPMLIMVASMWGLGIPLAYLLGFTFHFGLIGIATSAAISNISYALLSMWRWKVKSKAVLCQI